MSKKNILIIEDNLEVRENTAEILELSGYNVLSAENGKIGVEIALSNPIDLIICDVLMPELDGHGVLHILSKNSKTNTIPFVFLTAKADITDIRAGMKLGADDYITKPYNEIDLLETIDRKLARFKAIKNKSVDNRTKLIPYINEDKGFEKFIKKIYDYDRITYNKNDLIHQEGKETRVVYFVNKGFLKNVMSSDFNKELIVDFYSSGDIIALSNMLAQNKHYSRLVALENGTEIIEIDQKDFLSIIHDDIDINAYILKKMAINTYNKNHLLVSFAYESVRKRLADALVYLIEKREKNTIDVSRDELAQFIGTTKESVIRNLSDFKQEAFVKSSGNTIEIINKQGLVNIYG